MDGLEVPILESIINALNTQEGSKQTPRQDLPN